MVSIGVTACNYRRFRPTLLETEPTFGETNAIIRANPLFVRPASNLRSCGEHLLFEVTRLISRQIVAEGPSKACALLADRGPCISPPQTTPNWI